MLASDNKDASEAGSGRGAPPSYAIIQASGAQSRFNHRRGHARFGNKKNHIMPLSKVALMCLETSAFIKSDIFSSRNKARFTRWKLREIAATRIRRGQFETKYKLLRENPNDFFLNLRVSMDIFDYILEHIKEDLAARNVKGMSPEEQLFMTLK